MRNKILKAIDKNGRITPQDLAVMLGYDVDDVKREIEAMEKEHIICGYPTLINWDKTECERVTALIEVKVTPQRGQGFDKIAERIYNDGWLLGMEKGKEEGEQRLLRLLLQNGADPEWIQKITGLSTEQMQALEQPLPEIKRDPWIEY